MQEAAGKGLITGGIISLLVSLFLMFLRLNPGFIVPMADTLGICAICVLLFLLFSLRRSRAVSKRVESLERISGPIDNDVIRSVSKDTAFGNTWLAVGNKNRYRFWTKDMLDLLMDFIEKDERAAAYRGLDWSEEYDLAINGDPNDTQSAL